MALDMVSLRDMSVINFIEYLHMIDDALKSFFMLWWFLPMACIADKITINVIKFLIQHQSNMILKWNELLGSSSNLKRITHWSRDPIISEIWPWYSTFWLLAGLQTAPCSLCLGQCLVDENVFIGTKLSSLLPACEDEVLMLISRSSNK